MANLHRLAPQTMLCYTHVDSVTSFHLMYFTTNDITEIVNKCQLSITDTRDTVL